MDYTNMVKDFAKRTKANLATIEKLRNEEIEELKKLITENAKTNEKTETKIAEAKIFETTQFINSLLGLIIFPQQSDIVIPETSIQELKTTGWLIPDVTGGFSQVENLKQFITYLRHSIAHCNIKFKADDKNQINGLNIWNEKPPGTKIWETDMSLDELRNITDKFMEFLLNYNPINSTD